MTAILCFCIPLSWHRKSGKTSPRESPEQKSHDRSNASHPKRFSVSQASPPILGAESRKSTQRQFPPNWTLTFSTTTNDDNPPPSSVRRNTTVKPHSGLFPRRLNYSRWLTSPCGTAGPASKSPAILPPGVLCRRVYRDMDIVWEMETGETFDRMLIDFFL